MSDAPADAPAAPAKSKMLVIILCSVLAAGAAGGGVFFMSSKKGDDKQASEEGHKEAEHKLPAAYLKFDPPFVVNFENRGQMRFLQVSIEAMTRDPATAGSRVITSTLTCRKRIAPRFSKFTTNGGSNFR